MARSLLLCKTSKQSTCLGNGGSTLVVLKALYDRYGDEFANKKTLVIHAGGYSQRLPSASVMGKVCALYNVDSSNWLPHFSK